MKIDEFEMAFGLLARRGVTVKPLEARLYKGNVRWMLCAVGEGDGRLCVFDGQGRCYEAGIDVDDINNGAVVRHDDEYVFAGGCLCRHRRDFDITFNSSEPCI